METVRTITKESLDKYFNSLEQLGYISDTTVFKLIILSFLDDIVTDNLFEELSENDYKVIINAIYTLTRTNCIIPYKVLNIGDELVHNNIKSYIRLTEDSNIRVSKTIRITNN